jgi:hypothetical protein
MGGKQTKDRSDVEAVKEYPVAEVADVEAVKEYPVAEVAKKDRPAAAAEVKDSKGKIVKRFLGTNKIGTMILVSSYIIFWVYGFPVLNRCKFASRERATV